jgi:thioesterase domain-containing protein/acyl carrier protein
VTGHVAPSTALQPGRIDIAALRARCNTRTEALAGFLKQSFMDFGPRWGNVREIRFGRDEALLTLELPENFVSDLDSFQLHPALLDMATGGAQPLIRGFDACRDFYVPFSYGRLLLWKGFSRKLYSHVRLHDSKAQGSTVFDVTIAAEDGFVLAEISDFIMKRVSRLATEMPRQDSHEEVSNPSSAAELAGAILRNGITPREGIEAFERILSSGVAPQIIVSPVDPRRWLKLANAPSEPKPLAGAGSGVSARDRAAPTTSSEVAKDFGGSQSGSDPIERGLKELYCQLLGVENVGPNDDFFELGGHSLLAVRLLTRIEKEFKKAISLAELFQSPTIESLAAMLRDSAEPRRKESRVIVPFNEHGKGPAFYCVHSLGGEVASFRHLARILGPEHKFYGIQAPPEAQQDADFSSSIETMARYYVDALNAFQPEGPLLLGGWSAGSTIALEMAQQLIASGRKVDLLIALDGAPFNTGSGTSVWNPVYHWKLLRNFPHWVADDLMLDFSFTAFVRRVRSKVVALSKTAVKSLLRGKKAHAEVKGFLDMSYYSPNQAGFMNALYKALCAYVPKRFEGRVVLYKSRTQPLYHLLEVDRAWSSIAAQVDVIVVPGTHVSIMREPYICPVAEDLRERLSKLPN